MAPMSGHGEMNSLMIGKEMNVEVLTGF